MSSSGKAAEMYPEYLRTYKATGEEHQGSPLYSDGDGYYLYRLSDRTWRVSSVVMKYIGRSSIFVGNEFTAECPDSVRSWGYMHNRDLAIWRYDDRTLTAKCT